MTSNIAAGTKSQIDMLIEYGFLPKLVELCKHGKHEVKIEALWTLANAATHSNRLQISRMVK